MKRKNLLLLFCTCMISLTAVAQDTEFWFVAPDFSSGHSDAPVMFVFTNPNTADADVTIIIGLNSPRVNTTIPVPAGSSYKLDLSNTADWESNSIYAGQVADNGIHITSTQPILAYFMLNGASQRDIFSLKGKVALGTEFITPFQKGTVMSDHFYHGPSYNPKGTDEIDIVATESSTTVKFTPTMDCVNTGGTDYTAGTEYTVQLNYGQTFALRKVTNGTYEYTGTLTGTRITSDKPVAVTISEDCIGNSSSGAWDVAGDQLVPVDAAGTRYVVIRGRANSSNTKERMDFVATQDGTDITVYYKNNQDSIINLGAGQTWHTFIDKYSSLDDTAVFVQATKPVLCYQHTAVGGELGGAILPSMYSISQKQIDFYLAAGNTNSIFVVFKEGYDTDFEIYAGPTEVTGSLIITPQDIPFPAHIVSKDWKYAIIDLSGISAGSMVSVRNDSTAFSLGYFNGVGTSTASYGYLSGFASMSLPFDTLWICNDGQTPSGTNCVDDIELKTGILIADEWRWKIDDTPLQPSTKDTVIKATTPGMYTVEVDQDGYSLKDTCWVLGMVFDAAFEPRLPAKPAKVTVPQIFNVRYGAARQLPSTSPITYSWSTVGGGVIVDSTANHAEVIWNTTGRKQVRLHLSATGPGCLDGSGGSYDRICDTTLVYEVIVHEKHLGFFVDQSEKEAGVERNGASWDAAFDNLQQALALASQGDFIWVAEGTYSPADGLPAGQDSAMIRVGQFNAIKYMLDYDSIRVLANSYVMDYDSVQVFGGFSGEETNLDERDFAAHPTILKGSGGSVVIIDGGTYYTNGLWGVTRAARWDGLTIRDGSAVSGAGILFRNGASGTVSNTVVKSNTASGNGGGIGISGPCTAPDARDALFYNVEVSGNRASSGAGIYNRGSSFTAVNVTVSGNQAYSSAGGLYSLDGSPQIRNSIIWGNLAGASARPEAVNVVNSGGNPSYAGSDIGGAKPDDVWDARFGTDLGGNVDANPSFQRDGFDGNTLREGDYHLRYGAGNPAFEGGRNSYLLVGAQPVSIVLQSPSPRNTVYSSSGSRLPADLSNTSRILYEYVDMGAYEYLEYIVVPEIMRAIWIPEVPGIRSEPPAGEYHVKSRTDFTVVLSPADARSNLRNLTVATGSAWQEKGNMEIVRNGDGTVTLVFHEVNESLNVLLLGVTYDDSGSEALADGERLWSENRQLHVQAASHSRLKIYTLTGQLHRQLDVSSGKAVIPLPAGMYIVTLNDGIRQKIVIR